MGFAGRFVSGYLYGAERDGTSHVGGGSTHAWVQVYVSGAGWLEFDPTNGIVGNRGLIRVAVARDPHQAVPLYGTWTGFPSDNIGMSVEVEVTADALAGHGIESAAEHGASALRRFVRSTCDEDTRGLRDHL